MEVRPLNGNQRQSEATILVADDVQAILAFASEVLVREGHNVLTATSGEEAEVRAQEFGGRIDLLLSNIQMTGMTGIELATRLSVVRPNMRVMLMSGFSSGLLILNEGWHFLPKPFMPRQLADLVSMILASPLPPTINEHVD
jgi:two-component system, cell cycle sensor histidine kinase and response regulator CckA